MKFGEKYDAFEYIYISLTQGLPLVALDLTLTRFTGAGLARERLNFNLLEKVNLSCCVNLTDTGLHKLLASSGAALKDLVLVGTSISDAAFGGVHLKTRKDQMPGCSNVLDNVELSEKVHLPKLEVLDLSSCDNLANAGLHQLLTTSGSTLKHLDLSMTNISDAALAGVQLPRLEQLRLVACKNITDHGVRELVLNNGSHLKLLVLCYTNISDDALTGVRLPGLEVLYVGSQGYIL